MHIDGMNPLMAMGYIWRMGDVMVGERTDSQCCQWAEENEPTRIPFWRAYYPGIMRPHAVQSAITHRVSIEPGLRSFLLLTLTLPRSGSGNGRGLALCIARLISRRG